MELFEYDTEDIVYIMQGHEIPQEFAQDFVTPENSIIHNSPTPETSNESSPRTDYQDDVPTAHTPECRTSTPNLPPRLPTNLFEPQNLSRQLELPEVIDACQLDNVIRQLKVFNLVHPIPPSIPPRRSRRRITNPSSYALFDKTGEK